MKPLIIVWIVMFLVSCGKSSSPEERLFFEIDARNYVKIKNIIDKGINVNVLIHGATPLIYAVGGNEKKSEYKQIKNGEKTTTRENTFIVELLLENGADPNLKDAIGNTALSAAIMNGWVGSAFLLVQYGADLGPNSYGITPLWLTLDHCQIAIFNMLIKSGAVLGEYEKKLYTENQGNKCNIKI